MPYFTQNIKFSGKDSFNNCQQINNHCINIFRTWSFSGEHFPAFGLNTERYSVSFHSQSEWERIQSECAIIRTRKTPNPDTFQAVNILRFYSHSSTKSIMRNNFLRATYFNEYLFLKNEDAKILCVKSTAMSGLQRRI